ncbi:Pyridoxal-phosphate dependent enzyme [Dillenia turbinata]|uniref:Serine racemase n=1 Tax=Dillenia turbinata TaxID=194707 RepID=A0AAN8W7U7_9MAGN
MDTTNQTEKKYAADITSIREAKARVASFIHETPVLSSTSLNHISGRKLHFKCECFQKGGAFKFRGACNAILSLSDDQAAKGVVTHSSGNHAAALALAASLRKIPAYIVIPENAPKCKVENVIRYGGRVIWSKATVQSREEIAAKVLQETGAVLVHPYNDARIISGQGTISLELLEKVPEIDTIVVPISGGGLISGITLAAKSINPAIRVLAAEPRGADDAARSKAAGRIIKLPETNTVADGLRAFLGELTWPVVRDLVDDIILVEDEKIIEAMKLCYEILKVAVEPSGAVGLAAVLSDSFTSNSAYKDCNNIGIILSGGNIDLEIHLLPTGLGRSTTGAGIQILDIYRFNLKMEASNQKEKKYAADISSIREAKDRISSFIHKTPVLSSTSLNHIAGRNLHFKCECFQKGGAFKFRGACNAIFALNDDDAPKGVITHSSGNHAAAVSLAASLRKIPAYTVIPKNTPRCKVENVRRYGGQIVWSEATLQSREEVAAKVLQETGAVFVNSSNDAHIISGQGTVSLEFLEQVPEIDTIVVPISGGGLVSGVALAAKSINPAIRVLAAEPKGADDAARSKAAGRIVKLADTNTVAEGLRAFLGELTWPIVRDLVDDIIVLEDEKIIQAMKLCYEILKIAVEPSGAIGLAAVLSDNFRNNPAYKDCKNIGIILSGVAAKAINTAIRGVTNESRGADEATHSKTAGRIVEWAATNKDADGLRAVLEELTWPVVRDLVDDIIVGEDEVIFQAMKLCHKILKVAIEPSGAAGLARVQYGSFRNSPAFKIEPMTNHRSIILFGGIAEPSMLWSCI